jgi:hypothetical protein
MWLRLFWENKYTLICVMMKDVEDIYIGWFGDNWLDDV